VGEQDSTRWTLIRRAAAGESIDRAEFALRYTPLIRAYLGARWRASSLREQIDDAVQEVFVAFLAPHGALEKASDAWPGGFRAWLYGVVRNVARGFEKRLVRGRELPAGSEIDLDREAASEEDLARIFDREWARSLMREAGLLQEERAALGGDDARQRVELLRLRFRDGLPIREIAARWGVEAAHLHHEYARARREFQAALRDVMRVSGNESTERLDAECLQLLGDLG
jgi:RNA polymerase sigma factor (sigma-70 family)